MNSSVVIFRHLVAVYTAWDHLKQQSYIIISGVCWYYVDILY